MKSNYHNKNINTQSGNILIYILGAIILIGLLTIMVKGSNTPGAGIDREALEIRVAEVQQYGNELERAVAYILRNGYSESDIRFAHPNHSSDYGLITDTPGRQVFAREGGGATWQDNPSDIQTTDTDWVFNKANRVIQVGTTSGSAGYTNDLLAILPYVSIEFCILLNEKAGVENTTPTDPPNDLGTSNITALYTGGTGDSKQINSLSFSGKLEGCFEGDTNPPAGTYHYYRVLLAR